MHIKRITVTLPARLKNTAQHDARAIGEAVAQAVHKNGGTAAAPISVPGHRQQGLALARRVADALPKGKGGRGHGG